MIINTITIAKPWKIAPTTKYGGKMVVCQPGSTDEAKSVETIECTETTNTAAKPPRIKASASKRCHWRDEPVQPIEKKPYIAFLIFDFVRSLIVPKSGNMPRYQNEAEIMRYAVIAVTSQKSGELKFTQSGPRVLG